MPDAALVASLLQQSTAAHRRYRDASPCMVSNGAGGVVFSSGQPALARAALEQAAGLRQQAQDADPTHTAPAWQQESLHDALTAFYTQELAT